MTKHTRKRNQKGGFELSSVVDPVKNTSINAINSAENGLTNVSNFFGNAWASTKNKWNNLFSTSSSTSYVGGKRNTRKRGKTRHSRRRRRHHSH